MLWLTWRQHRAQVLVTLALLLAIGALLLASGLEASRYIAAHAPPGCPGPAIACGDVNANLRDRYDAVYTIWGWLPLVAPALIGAFWGAPLLGREYERGTNKLAWTQELPLRRWLAVKLGALAGLLVLGGLALSAMVTAWRPIFHAGTGDTAFGNIGVFNMVGVSPAAWWLFAFALGTAAGALFRRTLPAMATAVAGVAVAMFALSGASALYAEPVRLVTTDYAAVIGQDVRLVDQAWVSPSGTEIESPPAGACPRGTDTGRSDRSQRAYEDCLFRKGYRLAVYYHPPSRFWRFQWTEAAILLAGTLALGMLAVLRTARRRI